MQTKHFRKRVDAIAPEEFRAIQSTVNATEWKGHAPRTVLYRSFRAEKKLGPPPHWCVDTMVAFSDELVPPAAIFNGEVVSLYREVEFNDYDFGEQVKPPMHLRQIDPDETE